ncbi:DUF2726 domain-containing protein [Massilia sp. Leaf139]|uniref:DUF2726 domain-containing protein n=1 Tax=Massilia sp. Leaf139 TaxID=1736272 RepID=UPI0006F285F5|nr:DUF2726 domain-containing protein [Massilia sp. Leaf139]KQQ97325.1 hypothetical protein ASF77_05065 [Massilia sp. Leaf139]
MKTALVIVAFFVVFFLFAAVVAIQLKKGKGSKRTGAYRRRKLMTDNEREFFGRLVAALPGHYVFPQVAMAALIEAASSDRKTAHGDRLRIAQQRADYVVCDVAGEVIAVVELDDRTHSQAKDQLRDSRLEQAGIRTVRFQSRNKPTPAAILVAILGAPAAAGEPVAVSEPAYLTAVAAAQ